MNPSQPLGTRNPTPSVSRLPSRRRRSWMPQVRTSCTMRTRCTCFNSRWRLRTWLTVAVAQTHPIIPMHLCISSSIRCRSSPIKATTHQMARLLEMTIMSCIHSTKTINTSYAVVVWHPPRKTTVPCFGSSPVRWWRPNNKKHQMGKNRKLFQQTALL